MLIITTRRQKWSLLNSQNNRTSLSFSIMKTTRRLNRSRFLPRRIKMINVMSTLFKINRRFLPQWSWMLTFRNHLHKLLNIVIDFIYCNNYIKTFFLIIYQSFFNFAHDLFHLRRRSVANAAFELNYFLISFAYW